MFYKNFILIISVRTTDLSEDDHELRTIWSKNLYKECDSLRSVTE